MAAVKHSRKSVAQRCLSQRFLLQNCGTDCEAGDRLSEETAKTEEMRHTNE